MFTGNSRTPGSVLLFVFCALAASPVALAQTEGRWFDVDFPRDSPVLMVSFDLGRDTTAHVSGMSIAIDVHASLMLRNTGKKDISGLSLRVEAQDLTPAGKGSVTLPSLAVQPGDVFPVRIDMELLRPFNVSNTAGAMVRISLDCALFSDLTYYGPDKLSSRRILTVYELEARRDRRYLAALLRSGRISELRQELNFGLPELQPQDFGLELLRENAARSRQPSMQVHAVSFPSSPVQSLGGAAKVSGNEVREPEIEVRNSSQKTVRSIDMGWIVRDERGRDFVAGSMPASLQLAPVQIGKVIEPGTLRFSRLKGPPLLIEDLVTFISDVEFSDGQLWIPSRSDIDEATTDPTLRRALANSPEQQRLAEVFRRRGIAALVNELKTVN
ncbi:MAG: hypothetical protein JOZ62_08670 [Acidobacteriaceae bacterium]|nr:hypothetical protein [Acidobacteriaceae bacterium]